MTIFTPKTLCALPLEHPGFSLITVAVCTLSFVLSLAALAVVRPSVPIEVTTAKYVPAELMNYTLPYIVALVGVGYQDTGKVVGLTIFLIWLFWITHRSGQVILNPVLVVFGWRLYEVTYRYPGDSITRDATALAKAPIKGGTPYLSATLQDITILLPIKSTE